MPETNRFREGMPLMGGFSRLLRSWRSVCAYGGGVCLGPLIFMAGCATQPPHEVHQFAPIPSVSVGEQELAPISTRPGVELLQEAEAAYEKAREAKAAHDNESALKYYVKMQELLASASLDPGAFASVHNEFGDILASAGQSAPAPSGLTLAEGLKGGEGISPLDLPFPIPGRVKAEIEEIQQVYPKNFQSGLDRSQKYLPHVRTEFQKAGLPAELAWLAMVESLYTPKIVSRAGAGGMWQFMRMTGSRYHLRMDSYVDERYNWKSSTQAAINYLRDLHNFFGGSWPLAITAYNMGEGGMLRAVEANGGDRDFWRLLETPPACNRMATETKKYYPRFLAYLIVGANPERYGFHSNAQESIQTARVPVEGMYTLESLDEAMGYTPGTLAALNPDLVREVTPPAGGYGLEIPAEHQAKFAAALQQAPAVVATSTTHKVRRGESLADIAEQYGVSEQELAKTNHLRSSRHLKYGQTLRVPGFVTGRGGAAPAEVSESPSAPTTNIEEAPAREYVVKRGDTLFNIAKAHDLNVEDLARWNGLERRTRLKSGDRLRLTGPSAAAAPATAEPQEAAPVEASSEARYYTAKKGDFPAKIAKQNGISLENLMKWNGLSKKSTIRVGQKLQVSPPGVKAAEKRASKAPSEEVETITHTVAKGDTAGSIASKYGAPLKDVMAWNKLTAKSVLRVGQELSIQKTRPARAKAEQEPVQIADAATEEAAPEPVAAVTYKVAKGDTPGNIAKKYGVSLNDLMAWNNLTSKSVIKIGQELTVQPATKSKPAAAAKAATENNAEKRTAASAASERAASAPSATHKVAKGETASTIAAKYHMSLKDFMAQNNLTSKSVLQVGQELKVASAAAPAAKKEPSQEKVVSKAAEKADDETGSSAKDGKKVIHVVEKGNNPTLIAKRYSVKVSDLFKWNHWSGQPVLKVGEKVVVYTK